MYLLVDGYNLYYAGVGQPAAKPNLEKVRTEVRHLVQRYCEIKGCRAIIFWDGGPAGAHLPGRETRTHIEVRFSPPNSDADTEIKKHIAQHPNASELRVITSDREIQNYAAAHHVPCTRARMFLREVEVLVRPKELGPEGEPEEKRGGAGGDELAYWLHVFAERKKT